MIKTRREGDYTNMPVIVASIRDNSGLAIAAIDVVDVSGVFDVANLMSHHSQIINEMRCCAVPSSKL